jgi:hypothetical protein
MKCDHHIAAHVHGKNHLVRFEVLAGYVRELTMNRWVGEGEPPKSETSVVLKEFKKYPFCPKCGTRLEFEGQGLLQEMAVRK